MSALRIVIVLVLCCWIAQAQVDTGSVAGIVSDASGAVVPGVKIRITNQETGTDVDLFTNGSGFYAAPSLRPGRYSVSVGIAGFRAQETQPFEVRLQDRVEVNFTLQVGATTETVEIFAPGQPLEGETSSIG